MENVTSTQFQDIKKRALALFLAVILAFNGLQVGAAPAVAHAQDPTQPLDETTTQVDIKKIYTPAGEPAPQTKNEGYTVKYIVTEEESGNAETVIVPVTWNGLSFESEDTCIDDLIVGHTYTITEVETAGLSGVQSWSGPSFAIYKNNTVTVKADIWTQPVTFTSESIEEAKQSIDVSDTGVLEEETSDIVVMATLTGTDSNGYHFSIDTDTGEATITGHNWNTFTRPVTVNIPASVTYNSITYPVTAIGDNAFTTEMSNATSISIPEGVRTIGKNAFYNPIISTSVVTSVSFPTSSLTSIGEGAFRGCRKIQSIVIPDSVETIGAQAFFQCNGATTISLPNNPNYTVIENETFYQCSSAPSIVIPDSVESIGAQAFTYCSALQTVNIPDSVTKIGDSAFRSCSALTSVTFPNSVKVIGEEAFMYCTSLLSVTLPDSGVEIQKQAFSFCSQLSEVDFGPGIQGETTIGDSAFIYTVIEELTLPGNVTEIGKGAFSGLEKLKTVHFSEALEKIGENAFSECWNLEGPITIPDSVTYMGNYVFRGCAKAKIKQINHRKVAAAAGTLVPIDWPIEFSEEELDEEFESYVEFNVDNQNPIVIKGASWADDTLSQAEIVIRYAQKQQRELDIVFVIDNSASMLCSVEAEGADGETYTFPRSFLTEDILADCIEIILNANDSGNPDSDYDNRIALAAFGHDEVWTSEAGSIDSGFSADPEFLKEKMYSNPVVEYNSTNYEKGLLAAQRMIDGRSESERIPVIIFLSDGFPNDDDGTAAANNLREDGIDVYPIGIYLGDNPGEAATKEQAIAALEAISYSFDPSIGTGGVWYDGSDTDAFSAAMINVLTDITTSIHGRTVIDYLGEYFLDLENVESIEVSTSAGGGVATVDENGVITWNLSGCLASPDRIQAYIHELTIHVGLKDKTVSGDEIFTNAGTEVKGEEQSSTPQLERYIAEYEFKAKQGSTRPLPQGVLDQEPDYSGGYRNEAVVTSPTSFSNVIDGDGYWRFSSWDESTKTVNKDDLLFTGEWEYFENGVFEVTKTLDGKKDGDPVSPGEKLTYIITFNNDTPDDVVGIFVRDYVPTNTTYVDNSADSGGVYDPTDKCIDWFIPTIASGSSVTVSFQVTVDDGVAAGTHIKNKALYEITEDVTPPIDPGDPSKSSNETDNPVDPKSVDVGNGTIVNAGQELTYTISYTNTSANAQKVVITDDTPAYTSFVEASATDLISAPSVGDTGTVTWQNDALAPGDTMTVTLKVKIDDTVPAGTVIENQGAYSVDDAPAIDTNPIENPVDPKTEDPGELKTSNPASGTTVYNADRITYYIAYQNFTSEDTKVTIVDPVPDYTAYAKSSANTINGVTGTFVAAYEAPETWYDGNDCIVWEDVPIAKSEKITVSFDVKVLESGMGETITNIAHILPANIAGLATNVVTHPVSTESNPGNDPDLEDLQVIKSVDKTTVKPGENITYTIDVKNTGDVPLKGIMIRDYIPDHTTYISCDNDGYYGNINGKNHVTWTFDVLWPGEEKKLSFVVKVDEETQNETTITNIAMYGEGTQDPNNSNDPENTSNAVDTTTLFREEDPSIPGPKSNSKIFNALIKTGDGALPYVILGVALATMGLVVVAGIRRWKTRKR